MEDLIQRPASEQFYGRCQNYTFGKNQQSARFIHALRRKGAQKREYGDHSESIDRTYRPVEKSAVYYDSLRCCLIDHFHTPSQK